MSQPVTRAPSAMAVIILHQDCLRSIRDSFSITTFSFRMGPAGGGPAATILTAQQRFLCLVVTAPAGSTAQSRSLGPLTRPSDLPFAVMSHGQDPEIPPSLTGKSRLT